MSEKFECPECHKSFDTRRGLHIHIGEIHPEKKEQLFQKERKINRDDESFLDKFIEPRKVFLLLFIILLCFILFYHLNSRKPVEEGREISADEAGEIMSDLFIERSNIDGKNLELLNAEKTDSDVHFLEIYINDEKLDFFTTLDGTKFFLDYYDVETRETFKKEDAGYIIAEKLEKNLADKVEEDPQIRDFSVDYENDVNEKSKVYKVQTVFQANELPAERTKSYITRDGKYIFLEGFKTNEFEEIRLLHD